jgi:hypothetical protein
MTAEVQRAVAKKYRCRCSIRNENEPEFRGNRRTGRCETEVTVEEPFCKVCVDRHIDRPKGQIVSVAPVGEEEDWWYHREFSSE